MTSPAVLAAAMRFAELLSHAGDDDDANVLAEALITQDARVRRLGFAAARGECAETFVGPDAVVIWARRSPDGTVFECTAADEADSVRYRVQIAGFVGGGTWRLTLDAAGRIATLDHQPDELDVARQTDPEWREAVELSLQAQESGLDGAN